MDRHYRINEAFDYLRKKGIAHTQKDVSRQIGKCASNVSKAFSGNESVLTKGFILDFNFGYEGMFSLPWLLGEDADMLADMSGGQKAPRLNRAVAHLLNSGSVKGLPQLAMELDMKKDTIISCLTADSEYTESLIDGISEHYDGKISKEWLESGTGDMVPGEKHSVNVVAGDANNSIVGYSNSHCSLIVEGHTGESANRTGPYNKYGDSPGENMNWKPVIPAGMARTSDFDIMGHVGKQLNGNFERLYSGNAPVDVWHYLEDNDLYPFYQKGDCIGLKAYDIGDTRIKTGDVYAVDTRRDGLVIRRCRLSPKGDIITYTFNDSDPQEFEIPKEDVIRIYKKVIMFRY